MTAPELTPEQAAELAAVRDLSSKAVRARADFERGIRAAHPLVSVRQIALAAGLSAARVHQIIQAGPTPGVRKGRG